MAAGDLTDTIVQTAAEPASAAGDAGSATNQPLPDLIAADQYLAGKTAAQATNPKGGRRSAFQMLRTGVFVPKGAV
jgi:hypothetical protein